MSWKLFFCPMLLILLQIPSCETQHLREMGGRHEENKLQAHKIQQHLLSALYQRLFQTGMQQSGAEGERRAFPL